MSTSNDLDIFRSGIRRFRIGGIAVAALPLVLGFALLLAGDQDHALPLVFVSLILLFLIFWATHCAEEVITHLKVGRQNPG